MAGLTIRIRLDNADQILRDFKSLPKEASNELRDESLAISRDLVGKVQAAALADSPQAAKQAQTVKARRDRVPAIQVGGPKKVYGKGTRGRREAFRVLFGSEFGASPSLGRGFRPYRAAAGGRGGEGYWLFPTISANEAEVRMRWSAATDRVIRNWSE